MVMKPVAPYSIPKEPGRGRAIAMAIAVHGALLALLWIGISWQSETPVAVEAEIWSPQIREAAPKPRPEPEPQPEVRPEPKPVVKEIPAPIQKAPPKPVEKIEPIKPPDIALEQEKKRKAEQLKERLEEEHQEKLKKLAKEKLLDKEKQDKLAKQEAKEKLEKQEKQAKLDLKEKLDKQAKLETQEKQDKLDKQKKDDLKKADLDKKRKQDDADNKRLAKARDDEMKRITGVAVGTGGTGDAPKSQGPRGDPSYIQKVGAKIKSNTVFNGAETVEGNPAVEYAVELLPDGSLRGMRKLKSSGVPGFDEAVRRAIEKSQPFPADKSGTAPSGFTVSHKPKD
ncbi:cell envelope integrity protein TolA [Actimicrobium antarcticum]|uniref:Cell envelope integrity protein TolA n=1 Tax=Actimicrobium antarcticum TaxID=1051899 RepID=A0ABP7TH02_9BURK